MYQTVNLSITKLHDGEYKISNGISSGFVSDKTIIISDKNPNLLWNLLYELVGLPMPKFILPPDPEKKLLEEAPAQVEEPEKEEPKRSFVEDVEKTPLEIELSEMSAIAIINKVFQERGVKITNSLKSKSAIIKKALKIYSDNNTTSVT
jgi:hypothetical protein